MGNQTKEGRARAPVVALHALGVTVREVTVQGPVVLKVEASTRQGRKQCSGENTLSLNYSLKVQLRKSETK